MSSELKLILDYVYKGETQVKQENLRAFLEKAASLNIEGLDPKDAPATMKLEDSPLSDNFSDSTIEERMMLKIQSLAPKTYRS